MPPIRLLHVDTLKFRKFNVEQAEPYVVASHRWLSERAETSYKDVRKGRNPHKAGYRKVLAFCAAVTTFNARFQPEQPIQWIWIDTCCIDRKNRTELYESINSMCEWYERSTYCFAHLADVRSRRIGDTTLLGDFERSEWFKRGWTLQELLAPRTVIFFSTDWQILGCKEGQLSREKPVQREPLLGLSSLNDISQRVTGVPQHVLADFEQRRHLSFETRMAWASSRTTTRPEDRVYCMLGIFDVFLSLIYSEGVHRAMGRLEEEFRKGPPKPTLASLYIGHGLPPPTILMKPSEDGSSVQETSSSEQESSSNSEKESDSNSMSHPLLHPQPGEERPYNITNRTATHARERAYVSSQPQVPTTEHSSRPDRAVCASNNINRDGDPRGQIEDQYSSSAVSSTDKGQPSLAPALAQVQSIYQADSIYRQSLDSQRQSKATGKCPPIIVRRISASDRNLWNGGGPWGKGPPPSGDPANPYGYQHEPSDPESPREGERGFMGVNLSRDGQHWLTSRDILGHMMFKTTSPTGTRFAWDPEAKQRYIVRVESEDESDKSAEELP